MLSRNGLGLEGVGKLSNGQQFFITGQVSHLGRALFCCPPCRGLSFRKGPSHDAPLRASHRTFRTPERTSDRNRLRTRSNAQRPFIIESLCTVILPSQLATPVCCSRQT